MANKTAKKTFSYVVRNGTLQVTNSRGNWRNIGKAEIDRFCDIYGKTKATKKTFYADLFNSSYLLAIASAYEEQQLKHIETVAKKTVISDVESAEAFEGYLRDVKTIRRGRNKRLAAARKRKDNFTCQACGFRLKISGVFVIESHHLSRLADGNSVISSLDDLASLCPTCHRIAHMSRPPFSIAEIKKRRKKHRCVCCF